MGTRDLQASTQPSNSSSNLFSRLNDLDITSTIKAFQDGKKAYASKKYPDAIDYYTQALNHLKTDLESVILLHREAAYEQQQEHELVIGDTELAYINNNTQVSDDHIVHANALSLDKKHKEALETYEARLTVSTNNSSDNQHMNKPLNEKHQELFQALPNGIISTIVSNLSIKDRIRLSMASRSWNTFIHQWQSTCYNVNMHQDLSIDPTIDKKIFNAILEDEPKSIILGMRDQDIARTGIPAYFLNIIDDSKLNKINSLETGYSDIKQLENVLKRNSDRLTSLILHSTPQNYQNLRKTHNMVIRTTPDLRSFKQYFNHKNDGRDSVMGQEETQQQQLPSIPAQLSSSSLHLTKLTVANEMKIDTLIRLLKRTPHLQELSLNSIIYPNCMKVLRTICNVCPDIQQFHHVNMRKHPSCVTKYTLPSNESDSTSFSMGLKELTLEYFPMETEIFDDNDVYNIFQKYHDTLEAIEINAMELPLRFNCLDKLSVLGAPRLNKLVLDFYNNQNISTNTIMMIINNAKNLQDLTIVGTNFWEQKIFNTLAKLKDLRKLTIGRTHTELDLNTHEYVDEDPEEEYRGVMLKGSWFAPLFSSKKLIHFTYHQTELSGESFLLDLAPYIAKSSIQELNLETWIEDDESLDEFLNKLGNDNHSLRWVSLWLDFEYEAEDIAKFSRIKNLSYLNLVDITSNPKPFGKDMLSHLFQELQKRDKFAYVSLENQKRTSRIKGYTHGSSSLSSTSSSTNKLGNWQNFVLQEVDPPSKEEIEDDSDDDEPVYLTMTRK